MMLVTVWVFIGIEGASVYSARAANRADVGKATVIGFIGVLLLLVMVNVLSMGIMSQAELAGLKNPSMAGVLQQVVGPWGAALIGIGLIISLLGALLSWTLLCAEILFVGARDRSMPSFLARENAKHAPVNALWLSNGLIQLFLIITLFNDATYLKLIYLATSMILLPYFWSAAYAVLLAVRGETYAGEAQTRRKDLLIGLLALIYAVWLVYAGGLQYVLLSALLYAPGALFFAMAKREQGQRIFTTVEQLIFIAVLIGAGIAAYGLYAGSLSL
jgi:arginine:ornithine antiporter/lysine permease